MNADFGLGPFELFERMDRTESADPVLELSSTAAS